MNTDRKTQLNCFYLLCLCIFQVIGTSSVTAASTQDSEMLETVDLCFLFLDESSDSFYLKTASGFELLSKSPYAVANPKTFRHNEPIEIYKELSAATTLPADSESDAGARRIKIADFPAPDQFTAGLAVLAQPPQSSESNRFKVRFYAAPEKNPNNGVIQLINLGYTSIAAALGDTRIVIEPGENREIEASTDARNRLKVQVADKLDGEWKLIERRVVFLSPGERMTGVIVYSPSGMKHLYSKEELLLLGGTPPPAHAWLRFKN
jgi:hypothetical protein